MERQEEMDKETVGDTHILKHIVSFCMGMNLFVLLKYRLTLKKRVECLAYWDIMGKAVLAGFILSQAYWNRFDIFKLTLENSLST